MADAESCFKNALSSVSVHADSVWWHESKDNYRIANLNLWLAVVKGQDQSSEHLFDYQDDRSRYSRKSLQDVELPEEHVPDSEAWLKGHAWPSAIARNFPAISIALVGEQTFCRGLGPSLGNYLILKYLDLPPGDSPSHPPLTAQF